MTGLELLVDFVHKNRGHLVLDREHSKGGVVTTLGAGDRFITWHISYPIKEVMAVSMIKELNDSLSKTPNSDVPIPGTTQPV